MVLRLFYYQGVLQYRAQEAAEGQDQGEVPYSRASAPRTTEAGVDMRHNMAAARAAARGAKGNKDGAADDEVKVVPLSSWMAMAPPGTVSRVEV